MEQAWATEEAELEEEPQSTGQLHGFSPGPQRPSRPHLVHTRSLGTIWHTFPAVSVEWNSPTRPAQQACGCSARVLIWFPSETHEGAEEDELPTGHICSQKQPGSILQSVLQQSPERSLPSSHSSPPSRTLFPQDAEEEELEDEEELLLEEEEELEELLLEEELELPGMHRSHGPSQEGTSPQVPFSMRVLGGKQSRTAV